jgi:hypothetical protein
MIAGIKFELEQWTLREWGKAVFLTIILPAILGFLAKAAVVAYHCSQ